MELDRKIQEVQIKCIQSSFSDEIRTQEKIVIQKFSLREQQEEVFWNQKYRFKWIQQGERNTRFFHKASI